MPFWVVSGVSQENGCIRWGGDHRGKGAVLGVNVEHPIVTNGNLLRSCAKVREPIELSFGVVNGVGRGLGVLDGVHVPQGEGEVWGIFCPTGLNGDIWCILKTEVYSTHS